MLKLIFKDLLIQKKFLLQYILLFSFIAVFATMDLPYEDAALIMGAVSMAYILITTAFALDDKENSQIILNSFPVLKRDIVLAKYLSIFFFGVVGIIVISIVLIPCDLLNLFHVEIQFGVRQISIIFIYLIVFFSINFPIYFKIGYVNAAKYNIIMYLGVFFASYVFITNASNKYINKVIVLFGNAKQPQLCITLIALILALLGTSILVSLKVYSKRNI